MRTRDYRRDLCSNVSGLIHGASTLVLAGKPIGELIVQHGPFVMNTREEIEQALADYRDGTLSGR